jgi:hypothetical protein
MHLIRRASTQDPRPGWRLWNGRNERSGTWSAVHWHLQELRTSDGGAVLSGQAIVRYTTEQLTVWSWALLERPLDSFPAFRGTRRFITAFARALNLSSSWARPNQSTSPHHIFPRSILILSTTYVLVFLVVSFPLAFTNNLHKFLFSPIHATCPTHPILLYLIILIILEEYKSRSSSLCSFLHSPVTSSLFGPNILHSTLFSNILSLCSSLNVRD